MKDFSELFRTTPLGPGTFNRSGSRVGTTMPTSQESIEEQDMQIGFEQS